MQYTTPGTTWRQGLPIGNGRLAAMLWGDEQTDRLTLNHEHLWTGQYKNKTVPQSAHLLEQLRSLIKSGNLFAATAFGNLFWGGNGGISGIGIEMDDYVPAGELSIAYKGVKAFTERRLDLMSGVAHTSRAVGKSELCASYYADADNGGYVFGAQSATPFAVHIAFTRKKDERLRTEKTVYTPDSVVYTAAYKGGTSFCVRFGLETDGKVHADKNGIAVENATHIYLCGDCIVNDEQREAFTYAQTDIAAHTAAFSYYMQQTELDVGESAETDTGRLLAEAKEKNELTPALCKLHFDFGRYLFVAGSICASMPLHLQGKWNDSLTPPWNCDYHLNINLQMNYWAAEKLGFSELTAPLTEYLLRMAENGKKTARDMYGCRGFVFAHTADEWAHATPQAYGWAVWVSAAGWLGMHLWQHYLYTRDTAYLKKVYPYLRGVAEFYEDFAVADENGILQLMPSQSPENRYGVIGHFPVTLCRSSSMDVQVCAESLTVAAAAADILQTDAAAREKWRDMTRRLPPVRIGSDGRILEWESEQEEIEPGHRHLSHLYGAYPGNLFSQEQRADLFTAAIRSLDYRMAHGGGTGLGWSAAWGAILYARAGKAEKCAELLRELVLQCTTDTLLDLIVPDIFQIDGNFGGMDVVAEALVCVHNGVVHLGNAAAAIAPSGRMRGIRIPGGHSVNLRWENGKVTEASVTFVSPDTVTFVAQKNRITVAGKCGETKCLLACN